MRYFDSHTEDMTPAATTRYIKQCQTILKLCFGVNGRDLVAYSHAGDRFDHSTIAVAYRGLLQRIEQGDLKVPAVAMNIVDALMKDRPQYRGGTHSKDLLKLQSVRKQKYRKLVADMEEKLARVSKKKANPVNSRRSRSKKTIDLIGRSVLIPGDFYNVKGWWYKGRVVGRGKYYEGNRKMSGWRLAFPPQAGDTKLQYETWGTQALMKYLVTSHFTAADIDEGKCIHTDDAVFQIEQYDHVYAEWKNTDEWFYGCVHTHDTATYT